MHEQNVIKNCAKLQWKVQIKIYWFSLTEAANEEEAAATAQKYKLRCKVSNWLWETVRVCVCAFRCVRVCGKISL